MGIGNVIFTLLLLGAGGLFAFQVKKIRRNINLGRSLDRNDNKSERLGTMARVAMGQSKMKKRPIAGFLHMIVYVGFVLINIEVLEIVIDGVFGTHRVFASLGGFYDVMMAFFEVLAFLVLTVCVVFLIRRNVLKIKRFHYREMKKWPKLDANLILIFEIILMSALLAMNAADSILQSRGADHYINAGTFPISSVLFQPILNGLGDGSLVLLERSLWWVHIVGIFGFLNYLPISKHFHIILAFPNTYFSNLWPKGRLTNIKAVTNEVQLMMDPNADPFAAPAPTEGEGEEPGRFGAKDVQDLTWKNLLDAYTCTECGRCSSVCPANQTGKLLSPRKIMMDTRDRIEEVGRNIDKNKEYKDDGKSLLGDYILEEELWACTTCNACTDACPVNIDPLNIIMEMRRYLVMEESKSPTELTGMFNNIENNGAPWAFSPSDRLKWAEEA